MLGGTACLKEEKRDSRALLNNKNMRSDFGQCYRLYKEYGEQTLTNKF